MISLGKTPIPSHRTKHFKNVILAIPIYHLHDQQILNNVTCSILAIPIYHLHDQKNIEQRHM